MIFKYVHIIYFCPTWPEYVHLVYYLDSFNNHFRREVRVLYGIEDSFDALDVVKYEVSYY